MNQNDKVLVIAAHPDDEILGCGGFIHLLREQAIPVAVMFLTDGVMGRTGYMQKDVDNRKAEAWSALNIVGVEQAYFMDFPDQMLERTLLRDLADKIYDLVKLTGSTVVLTHSAADLNQDHRRVFDATMIACRPTQVSRVRMVISYPVLSSTEYGFDQFATGFKPNLFVELPVQSHRAKQEAMRKYGSELCEYPHPRCIPTLAMTAELVGSRVGFASAECFQIIYEKMPWKS